MKAFNITGYLSLFFGTLAVLFTLQLQYLFFAIPFALLGNLSSIIHIFIGTRREMNLGILNRGTIGLLLSSVPILILLYIIFTSGK